MLFGSQDRRFKPIADSFLPTTPATLNPVKALLPAIFIIFIVDRAVSDWNKHVAVNFNLYFLTWCLCVSWFQRFLAQVLASLVIIIGKNTIDSVNKNVVAVDSQSIQYATLLEVFTAFTLSQQWLVSMQVASLPAIFSFIWNLRFQNKGAKEDQGERVLHSEHPGKKICVGICPRTRNGEDVAICIFRQRGEKIEEQISSSLGNSADPWCTMQYSRHSDPIFQSWGMKGIARVSSSRLRQCEKGVFRQARTANTASTRSSPTINSQLIYCYILSL